MSDSAHNNHTTTTTTTRESRGNSGIAFIVGILVVVVAFLAWIIFGSADTTTATDDGGSNVNITVESDEGASAPAANTDAAPAGDDEPSTRR